MGSSDGSASIDSEQATDTLRQAIQEHAQILADVQRTLHLFQEVERRLNMAEDIRRK